MFCGLIHMFASLLYFMTGAIRALPSLVLSVYDILFISNRFTLLMLFVSNRLHNTHAMQL